MTSDGEEFITELIRRCYAEGSDGVSDDSDIQIKRGQKLKPERKAEWLAALRSGEYKQVTGALRKEAGFCCLGVQCDLSKVADWRPVAYATGGPKFSYAAIDTAEPPFMVAAWAYEPREDRLPLAADPIVATVTRYGQFERQITLAGLNDNGASFEEIARVIEEVL